MKLHPLCGTRPDDQVKLTPLYGTPRAIFGRFLADVRPYRTLADAGTLPAELWEMEEKLRVNSLRSLELAVLRSLYRSRSTWTP